MNLLGLMISNIRNSGKHTFLCRVKSFEFTAGFITFLGGKTNTALYKEVQSSSSPQNTRNTLKMLFSCMKTWDRNKPGGLRLEKGGSRGVCIYQPLQNHETDTNTCRQPVLKVRYVVHGYLSQGGDGSDKGAAAPFP